MAKKFAGTEPPKRKVGRPKGVKNRQPKHVAPAHTDPTTLIERQFGLAEMMQSSFAAEMAGRAPDAPVSEVDVDRFATITQALSRAVDTLRKADNMAEAMEKRMTADQLLEAALRKLEAQDARTIKYAVKRLRARYESLLVRAPQTRDGAGTAVSAIAALGDEE